MKTKKILFYLLAASLASCVPVMSLHPLYTEEDVVFEEKLLGLWVDDSNESTWEFRRSDESEKAYELIFSREEVRGLFAVHLIRLEETFFLDVFPPCLPSGDIDDSNAPWPYNMFFFVPVHTFIKVNSIEPRLNMQITDDDKLKELLKEEPKAIKHEVLEEDYLVLTASTKELQDFVLKYADDARLFPDDEMILSRKKTEELDVTDPNDTDPNEGQVR